MMFDMCSEAAILKLTMWQRLGELHPIVFAANLIKFSLRFFVHTRHFANSCSLTNISRIDAATVNRERTHLDFVVKYSICPCNKYVLFKGPPNWLKFPGQFPTDESAPTQHVLVICVITATLLVCCYVADVSALKKRYLDNERLKEKPAARYRRHIKLLTYRGTEYARISGLKSKLTE